MNTNQAMIDMRRIAARVFFTDNEDQYEDFHEALTEFISGENQTDEFIEFCVSPYIKPENGCRILVRDDGHVMSVRESDGLVSPRTEMTQEEGEEIEDQFTEITGRQPELGNFEALAQIGWREMK